MPNFFGEGRLNLPETEERVLEYWQTHGIEKKALTPSPNRKKFVFYEGPPTANGKPGIHHIISRAFKDVIPRYKTMRGYYVTRKGGWDTHGLPVEIEVEKKLGLKSKKEIEEYGIAKFNRKCKESVWEYKKEWERFTKRIGFWLDLESPYITYENSYIETLWWVIKRFWDKKLLYKGHRVAPWCTRCGTALSSHEMAQGYERVEDTAVYVKFKLGPSQFIRHDGGYQTDDNTYIISWTTTPWTLPGNVALAVGEDISYTALRPEGSGELHIVASDLVSSVYADDYVRVVDNIKGKDLVDLEYEPLFDIPALQNENSHKIYAADFVNTEEGTGVVHTAVMYGEDDYQLGTRSDLPKHHTVRENGTFSGEVKELAGMYAKDKKTEEKIFEHLKIKNYYLKIAQYAHDYPHCWRCSTPLLYYARESWFVKMSALRSKLLSANTTVNWIPPHMKEGRFGEWIRDVKDWNFSRERYWGTPLPVWECKECGHAKTTGSFGELESRDYFRNEFYLLRHTEAEHNVKGIEAGGPETKERTSRLTEKGEQDARSLGEMFRKKGIDVIYTSPFARTRAVAEAVSDAIGAPVTTDERLGEKNFGVYNWKSIKEHHAFYKAPSERFVRAPEGGETYHDVRERMIEAIKEINETHRGKKILIVGHGDPLWLLETVIKGVPDEKLFDAPYIKVGELRELPFPNLPRDERGYVDPHRPYIDNVYLRCEKCDGKMERVKEVVDVWFDSGSMPFAQAHFPFACGHKHLGIWKPRWCVDYPADYIAEAVDQTRGWFYTLLAVAIALGYRAPYRNVISLGHVLDKQGKKMSKSKGNVVDPWEMMEKYGIDAVRWYFYTTNPPGEPTNFDETELAKVARRVQMLLYNCHVFYRTYGDKLSTYDVDNLSHVLDQWILARLHETTRVATKALDGYDMRAAALAIEELTGDLSRWYVRRSRSRFQRPEDREDYAAASATLGHVLREISKLLAPFMPFFAEALYRALDGEKESVHFEAWPHAEKGMDAKLISLMAEVRRVASEALAVRAEAGVKVRQPLQTLRVRDKALKGESELLEILKDEVNVEEVVFDGRLESEIELDVTITPALRVRGLEREGIRAVQELRQKAGYTPDEKNISRAIETDDKELVSILGGEGISAATGTAVVHSIASEHTDAEGEVEIDGKKVKIRVGRSSG